MNSRFAYAVHLLVSLAMDSDGKPKKIEGIAKKHGFSHKYLWRVASDLKKAGIAEATRGYGGGLRLARPPSEITLADVYAATEGFLEALGRESKDEIAQHVVAGAMGRLREAWMESASRVTVQELVDQYRAWAAAKAYEFVI